MTCVWTCWYLCGVFLLGSLGTTLVDAAPDHGRFMLVLTAVLFALAVTSALAALFLRRTFKKASHWFIFRSKVVSTLFIVFAVLLTVFLLFPILA